MSSKGGLRRVYSDNDCSSVDNPSFVFQPAESVNWHPRVVHVTNAALSNPLLLGPHPLSPTLYLLVYKLSEITFLTKAFFRRLPTLSCVLGSQIHNDNTSFTFKNGMTFILRDNLIHFVPLERMLFAFSILNIDKSCLILPLIRPAQRRRLFWGVILPRIINLWPCITL